MLKEAKYYRENLERIQEAFPDKEILSLTDISRWWGVSTEIVSRQLCLYRGGYITKPTLARKMASLHEVPVRRKKIYRRKHNG